MDRIDPAASRGAGRRTTVGAKGWVMQLFDFGFWISDFGLGTGARALLQSGCREQSFPSSPTGRGAGGEGARQSKIPFAFYLLPFALCYALLGCGRVISQKATDQLIAGDAVDRSVSQIDFRVFSGKKIFLDTQYVPKAVPGVGFVTSDYIVSSVRQKMMGDGCLLQEKEDTADFVVEMRIGALGADGHEVIYGLPPNNFASIAASVVPSAPAAAAAIPAIPELSFGKTDDQMAAAKIALFAFNKRTREPIWQSGISESRSTVADRWYFGAGPFHRGAIYSTQPQDNGSGLFGSSDAASVVKSDYFAERQLADPTKSLKESPLAAAPSVTASTQPGVGAQGKLPNASLTAATTGMQQGSQPGLQPVTGQKTASVPVPPLPGPAVPPTAAAPTSAANMPAAAAPPALPATTSSNRSAATSAASTSAALPGPPSDAFSGATNLAPSDGARAANFGDGLNGSPAFSGPSWNEQNLWTLSQSLP
jgi:hypothetical protein